jgi:multiple sugar transport system permease protein
LKTREQAAGRGSPRREQATAGRGLTTPSQAGAGRASRRRRRGRRVRGAIITAFVIVAVFPILVILLDSLLPPGALVSGGLTLLHGFTLSNYRYVLDQTTSLLYLRNSLIVSIATAALTVVIGAPGGYALARGKGRDLSAYALSLFVYQALPTVVFVIPLFLLFVPLHLVNTLQGLVIVYTAGSLPFGIWMLRASFEAIPFALEEAARVDGCSMIGAFRRIVLPNSGPGILSVGLFSFLVAWNDYLVAVVIERTNGMFTLPIGLETFFQEYSTEWGAVMALSVFMLVPPVLLFMIGSRYFRIGGIGGSLVG